MCMCVYVYMCICVYVYMCICICICSIRMSCSRCVCHAAARDLRNGSRAAPLGNTKDANHSTASPPAAQFSNVTPLPPPSWSLPLTSAALRANKADGRTCGPPQRW